MCCYAIDKAKLQHVFFDFSFYPYPVKINNLQRSQGFTLIELLVVVAVILILASISIGVAKMVGQKQELARAKGDIAVLATSLESYRLLFGDYPWVDNYTDEGARELYAAMIGNRSPLNGGRIVGTGQAASIQDATGSQDPHDYNKNASARKVREHFVEISKFSIGAESNGTWIEIEKSIIEPDLPRTIDNQYEDHGFIDPWGNPYLYRYRAINRSLSDWDRTGFLLMSMGPDSAGDFETLSRFGADVTGIFTWEEFFNNEDLADNIVHGY